VLESDNSTVLRRLMKYPPVENPHLFVEKALESRKTPYQKFSFNNNVVHAEKVVANHPLSTPHVEKKPPMIRPIGATLPSNKQYVYKFILLIDRPTLPNLSSISSHLPHISNPLPNLFSGMNEHKPKKTPKTPIQQSPKPQPPPINLDAQIEKEKKLANTMDSIIDALTMIAFPK
jgi:hypothetical protein